MKLALLGKNIAHSKSQEMYESILNKDVEYTLLDHANESEIPSLEEIFSLYDGLSITSPYKRHFLNNVEVRNEVVSSLGSINCIHKSDGMYLATNTDYEAVKEILNSFVNKYSKLNVVVLGGGSMSILTQVVCKELDIDFKLLTRKSNGDLSNLDLVKLFSSSTGQKMVINSCAREYIFTGKIDSETIFWDYNYNFEPHQVFLSDKCRYVDGLGLLRLQAVYALKFWGILPG